MKIDKTNKKSEKNLGSIRGIHTKSLVPELLTNPTS